MTGHHGCELDVIAALITADDTSCHQTPISVTWTYRRDDPYAVRMSFPALPVSWLLGRDLLIAGIEKAAGDGDVHLMTTSGYNADVTIITIGCRWADQTSLGFATSDLIAFLSLTNDIVPLGAESALVQNELHVALAAWAAGADETGACS